MAYPTGTTLKRLEPRRIVVQQLQGGEYDESSNQIIGGEYADIERDDPFNHIRILAPSPVSQASVAAWQGGTGDYYVITPVDEFGSNEIIPESVLNSEYEIDELPEDQLAHQKIHLDPARERLQQGRSPEQVFAAEAQKAKAAAKRGPGRPKKADGTSA